MNAGSLLKPGFRLSKAVGVYYLWEVLRYTWQSTLNDDAARHWMHSFCQVGAAIKLTNKTAMCLEFTNSLRWGRKCLPLLPVYYSKPTYLAPPLMSRSRPTSEWLSDNGKIITHKHCTLHRRSAHNLLWAAKQYPMCSRILTQIVCFCCANSQLNSKLEWSRTKPELIW